MSKRVAMVWPLPTVVHPAGAVCYKVTIPNERAYIGAFLGAMFLLSKPYAWGDDSDHTALEVGKIFRAIFDGLEKNNCGCPPQSGDQGSDGGDEMALRQNPDNPCLLEFSVGNGEWCTFADLSLCTGAPGQPGSGTPQPPAGGCQGYPGVMNANSPWLLPAQVSSGDVLTFQSLTGAGTDGTGNWYCPNGSAFFAGFCVGSPVFSGSDPLPSSPHMSILALINGIYYPFIDTLTIPGGISNAQVQLQVNDPTLSDNGGQYQFNVEYCNNGVGTFSHLFDFSIDDGGWTGVTAAGVTPTYAAGAWNGASYINGGCGGGIQHATQCQIQKAMPASRFITSFRIRAFVDTSNGPGGGARDVVFDGGSPLSLGIDSSVGVIDVTIPVNQTVASTIQSRLNSICFASDPVVNVLSITVNGNGTDPF